MVCVPIWIYIVASTYILFTYIAVQFAIVADIYWHKYAINPAYLDIAYVSTPGLYNKAYTPGLDFLAPLYK